MISAHKFTETNSEKPNIISGFETPQDFLTAVYLGKKYTHGQNHSLQDCGCYKEMGWLFDFNPFLKTFLIKQTYGGWQQVKAPNKTLLRKCITGKIIKIVELEKKEVQNVR